MQFGPLAHAAVCALAAGRPAVFGRGVALREQPADGGG